MQGFDEDELVSWRVVRSYPTLKQAQHAVHDLDWARFPAGLVAIVARDPRPLDRWPGRSGYGWASIAGALLGLPVGGLLGLLLALFVLAEPLAAALTLAAWAALAGAIAGPAVALGTEALRAPPDGRWPGVVHADRYDLVADEQVAEQAHHLLAGLGHHPAATA